MSCNHENKGFAKISLFSYRAWISTLKSWSPAWPAYKRKTFFFNGFHKQSAYQEPQKKTMKKNRKSLK